MFIVENQKMLSLQQINIKCCFQHLYNTLFSEKVKHFSMKKIKVYKLLFTDFLYRLNDFFINEEEAYKRYGQRHNLGDWE